MPIQFWNGMLLFRNGVLAMGPDCCCGESGCCLQLPDTLYVKIAFTGPSQTTSYTGTLSKDETYEVGTEDKKRWMGSVSTPCYTHRTTWYIQLGCSGWTTAICSDEGHAFCLSMAYGDSEGSYPYAAGSPDSYTDRPSQSDCENSDVSFTAVWNLSIGSGPCGDCDPACGPTDIVTIEITISDQPL